MAKTKEPGITKIEGAKGFYRLQIRIKNGEHLSKNGETFKEAKERKWLFYDFRPIYDPKRQKKPVSMIIKLFLFNSMFSL